jgi:hypothetical protein
MEINYRGGNNGRIDGPGSSAIAQLHDLRRDGEGNSAPESTVIASW